MSDKAEWAEDVSLNTITGHCRMAYYVVIGRDSASSTLQQLLSRALPDARSRKRAQVSELVSAMVLPFVSPSLRAFVNALVGSTMYVYISLGPN